MIVKLHPIDPQPRVLNQILDVLKNGGVIIYPTDSVYGIGCDIFHPKAVERIARIKGIQIDKAHFSMIFRDLSHISEFCKNIDTPTYKILKQYLPGPYTFILNTSNNVPKVFTRKKKTIGIRIPKNKIITSILEELGSPLLTTSVKDYDEIIKYTTDPELIHERYQNQVDLVIDGGNGNNVPTTVVDLTGDEPVILREGIGKFE